MILPLILLGVAVAAYLWFRKGSRLAPRSPWSEWVDIPAPRPLETDIKKRDAVIAQSYKPSLVEGQKWDAVIIGSGIGGLSTAALLSKAGWRVLVLEQHDTAGGCCHTFVEKGFEFDVGIHYIGKVHGNTEFRAYLDQITDGQLEWAPLEPEFDHIYIGEPGKQAIYPVVAGPKDMRAQLLKSFPDEEAGIDAFFAKLKATRKESVKMSIPKILPLWLANIVNSTGLINLITSFFRQSQESIQEAVEGMTENKDLQAVLSYCWGDFGSAPSEGPWTMQAMLWTHFWEGAGYPIGGASQISHSIIPVIEKSGGRVLVRAPVTGVAFAEDGTTANGVFVGKAGTRVSADVVISDAGLVNTFTKLVPKHIAERSRYTEYIQKIGPGHAAIQLFVGLEGSAKDLGLVARNYWIFKDNKLGLTWEEHTGKTAEEALGSDPVPLLFVSFPSTKDPTWEARFPGKSVATIVSFGKWDWFSQWDGTTLKKRGEDYNRLKAEFTHAIWERIIGYFPQLTGKDSYMEFGSPLSTQHYIGAGKGEIYGLDHSRARFTPEAMADLRPKTDVPGLYLTGQDVMACGFSGAAYGGLLCANEFVKGNLFLDLVKIRKDRAAKKEKAQ